MFSNYRIPRENLLNKTGDVTPDGQYESVFSEPTKILGAALESFSAGRVGIMQESSNTLADAIVIAIRYAAVRKQFGTDIDGPETPIIEYQLHVSYCRKLIRFFSVKNEYINYFLYFQQWRLFPYLAAACVLKVSVTSLTDVYLSIVEKSRANSNGFEQLTQEVSEIHALISSSKALLTWTARDAIQEAREACGGHVSYSIYFSLVLFQCCNEYVFNFTRDITKQRIWVNFAIITIHVVHTREITMY